MTSQIRLTEGLRGGNSAGLVFTSVSEGCDIDIENIYTKTIISKKVDDVLTVGTKEECLLGSVDISDETANGLIQIGVATLIVP